MQQGVLDDSEATSRGRGVEEHDGGLLGLWETFGDGFIIQIPWEVADSSG